MTQQVTYYPCAIEMKTHPMHARLGLSLAFHDKKGNQSNGSNKRGGRSGHDDPNLPVVIQLHGVHMTGTLCQV